MSGPADKFIRAAYIRSMRVMVGPTGLCFHTKGCFAVGVWNLREVDLAEILDERPGLKPCMRCFPDAPGAKMHRRLCPECNKARPHPCPHNGGVKVPIRTVRGTYCETTVKVWMWEDRARLRGLVS